jgi:hypothetical protein
MECGMFGKKGVVTTLLLGLLSANAFADIYGYVKLPQGDAMSGVSVALKSSGKTAVTDANGYYQISTEGTTIVSAPVALNTARFESGNLLFSLNESASVRIAAYNVLGKTVFNAPVRQMSAGEHDIALFDEKTPKGVYLVKVKANNLEMTYRVNFSSNGSASIVSEKRSLRKVLAVADSLTFSYNGSSVQGSVPVYNDEGKIADVVLTHKNVMGKIPTDASSGYSVKVSMLGSSGEKFSSSAVVAAGEYKAESPWMVYDATRTWEISANNVSLKGIKDDVLSVQLDLNASVDTTKFNLSATLEADGLNYSFVTVDLNPSNIAGALGISESALSSVTYYAVNPDGTFDSVSTANNPGHWFNQSGKVVEYGSEAYVYSEVNMSAMTANVGQYPGKLEADKIYTIRQAFRSGNKIALVTISLNVIVSGSSSSSGLGLSSSSVSSTSSSSSATSAASSSSSTSVVTTITMASLATSNPDRYKFVNWEWDYRLSQDGIAKGSDGTYDDYRIESARNWTFYQIVENGGYLNFCVRWQSPQELTLVRRQQIVQMLNDEINLWAKHLVGFEGWPYDSIPVNVTGWAVLDESIVKDKQSDEIVYANYSIDDPQNGYDYNITDNAVLKQPMCPDACSRSKKFYGEISNYNSCPNYSKTNDTHFDQFIQPVAASTSYTATNWGFASGTGEGLWINDSYLISTLGSSLPHIVVHESGHNWGLPDFYESWDFPDANFSSPMASANTANSSYSGIARSMVMNAGSSATVTEDDAWLLRKIWYEIKSNMGF